MLVARTTNPTNAGLMNSFESLLVDAIRAGRVDEAMLLLSLAPIEHLRDRRVDMVSKLGTGTIGMGCGSNELADNVTDSPSLMLSFLAACQGGHCDVVSLLLDRGGLSCNSRAPDGRTPLGVAVESGRRQVVQLLLDCGADGLQADDHDDNGSGVGRNSFAASSFAEDVLKPHRKIAYCGACIDAKESASISTASALTADDIAHLKSLCASVRSAALSASISAAESLAVTKPDSFGATLAYISATTKKCPNPACGLPQTHYHGHQCHHVHEGCYSCKTHFCYRCLATAEENRRERGEQHVCKCGSWSSGCESEDLLSHLVLLPYPHDRYNILLSSLHHFLSCNVSIGILSGYG